MTHVNVLERVHSWNLHTDSIWQHSHPRLLKNHKRHFYHQVFYSLSTWLWRPTPWGFLFKVFDCKLKWKKHFVFQSQPVFRCISQRKSFLISHYPWWSFSHIPWTAGVFRHIQVNLNVFCNFSSPEGRTYLALLSDTACVCVGVNILFNHEWFPVL